MVSPKQIRTVIFWVLSVCVCSCAGPGQPQPRNESSGNYDSPVAAQSLRSRATNWFSAALFLKPIEHAADDLAFKFAPLIVQQLADTNASPAEAAPGSVTFTNETPGVEATGAAVYWHSDSVVINGREHTRFTYAWFYPGLAEPGATAALRQGIRIIMTRDGAPAIWEVLTETSGADLLFVSRALESQAHAEFGEALPGRALSIERPVGDAPRTVVARIIEDGPMPMGPLVYLVDRTHDVATILCRCMPSQARTLVSTATYELVSGDHFPLPGLGWKSPPSQRAANFPGWNPQPLEHRLRLPASF